VGGDTGKAHLPALEFDDEQYNRCRNSVSTVKKSHARMPAAWRRRNARQVGVARRGAGSMPWIRSTRLIELVDTWQPRRSNSPRIRW
jgi:hypothetical protein